MLKSNGSKNLRKWAIGSAILALITTSFLLFVMVLDYKNTEYAWQLVDGDLKDEDVENENSVYNINEKQIESNKKKLEESWKVLSEKLNTLFIGITLAFVNELTCCFMLYGIGHRVPKLILTWIFTSGITFVLVSGTILWAFFNGLPGLHDSYEYQRGMSVLAFGAVLIGSLYVLIWFVIVAYFKLLLWQTTERKNIGTVAPVIMTAYGGYVHKVDDTPIEKKIIV